MEEKEYVLHEDGKVIKEEGQILMCLGYLRRKGRSKRRGTFYRGG